MCGATTIPCGWENQVDVSINWHELRILIMWAENYWNGVKKEGQLNPIYAIAERIRAQHPDRAKKLSLTLAGEIQQIVDHFGSANVTHTIPGVEGGTYLERKDR